MLGRAAERLDAYTLELQRHGLDACEREVRWLEELIATERSGRSPGTDVGTNRTPPRTPRPVTDNRRTHNSPSLIKKEAATMGSVRVAIVGVGNCASSLVQGVEYYRNADPTDRVPGLMHVEFGDYHVSDVQFVAAFDVDAKKVGQDLAEAIVASENNTIKLADVPPTGDHRAARPDLRRPRPVLPGDRAGVGRGGGGRRGRAARGQGRRRRLLPAGRFGRRRTSSTPRPRSTPAARSSTRCPSSSRPTRCGRRSSTDAGLPIVGDDIKSQVGATIVHRALAKLFEDRGVELLRTYQLNFGGNMDFMNMLERNRLVSKKISKTQSVTSQIPHEMSKSDVHIGPSDHVPWLDDRKWAYIRLEGRSFGDVPLNAELKLEVWDSPNSAGVIIDAVRAAKIALDRKIGGPILSASSYFMKSPPVQYNDHDAKQSVEDFITGTIER